MATNPSPDPKGSMWDFVAYYLRFCRSQRQLSGERLGYLIGVSKPSVSRLENGSLRLDGKQAVALDRAWETGGLFSLLVWYASIGHDPQWFQQYMDLEQQAGTIRIFQAQVIPGLIQTEDYARALLSTGDSLNAEGLLEIRMSRQEILARPTPPFLSVLVSQNALECPVGSPEITKTQLSRLLEVSERSRVVVRVVPRSWETGAHPGLDGSFSLMSGDDYGEVAYTESPGGGRLVSPPRDVRDFGIRYDRISGKALPEGPSRDLIRRVMEAI